MFSITSTSVLLLLLCSLLPAVSSRSLAQAPQDLFVTTSNLPTTADTTNVSSLLNGSPINDTDTTLSQCFTNTPGYPAFRPVHLPDCLFLFFSILVRPSAATPFRWDAATTTLPAVYTYGTCVISIYAGSATAKEVFTELGVARAAALVTEACVTPARSWLGGKRTIGDTQGYWVALGGRGRGGRGSLG